MQMAPSRPTSLLDLHIPECYTKLGLTEPFLLYDSGNDSSRFLIFATENNLTTLASSSQWFCDGTFSVTPLLFTQMYSIHCEFQDGVLPMVYVLMSRMTKNDYVNVLEALNTLNPNLAPESIMTDYERSAISAFSDVFPLAGLRGCFFHFSQCLWKRFSKIPEALLLYKNNADFALNIKCVAALAFCPPSEVISAFEKLMKTLFFTSNEFLRPFLIYFEEVWIGKPTEKGRRSPLFNIS